MKIKVCKDYSWRKNLYESDKRRYYENCRYADFTMLSDYSVEFINEEVNEEQLLNYINKGYAIKINL